MSSIKSASEESDAIIVQSSDIRDFNSDNILPVPVEDFRKIREWLQPTPYEEERSEYSRHVASHLAGTGRWLTCTTTYQQWHQGHDNGLLWIKGIPGSGKSVMAASIISQLRKEADVPILYFFFRQIIDANHKPIAALRDWLCQILDYSPPLQVKLKKDYLEQSKSLDSLSPNDLWKCLGFALASFPKVYCVIDALDEMDQGNNDFLHALVELGQWRPANVKVLITSRPVVTVENPLRSFSIPIIRLEERLVDIDIAVFVQYRLRNSSIPHRYWTIITEAIPGRANGLFLYAKLSMDAFLEPGADPNVVLKALPADLNVMYNDLLREHARRSNVPDELQVLILQFVTHATRPLRLLEIAEMVKTTLFPVRSLKETKDLVRAACGPLLEILPDETVSVVHHSFTEFLKGITRKSTEANDSTYPVLEATSTNRRLAIACLDYMRSGCLDNLKLQRRDTGENNFWPEESRHSAIRLEFPFLEYAAANWYIHTRRAVLQAGEEMNFFCDILNTLFADKQRLNAWLEIDWPDGPVAGLTTLHIAARTGLVEYATYLFEKGGVEPDMRASWGETPLYWAAKCGSADVARVLLANGADPDAVSHKGLKPLHAAASNNCAEMVKVLLAAGVDPLTPRRQDNLARYGCGNAPSSIGHTPLMYACNSGHLEAVSEFLPYLKDTQTCQKALHWAASSGRAAVVARILQHPGVDVNAKTAGDTALFAACQAHDQKTIEVLLRAGADPNIRCSKFGNESTIGTLPLYISTGDGESQLTGYTALHAFCGFTESSSLATLECLDLLLKAGADVHVKSQAGLTALRYACDNNPKLAKRLLEAGASGISIHTDGKSDEELLPEILGTGLIDINDRLGKSGKTPLHCRIEGKNPKAAINFLKYKPDVNIADFEGNGPLHMALKNQYMNGDVIDALLSAGADPNLQNKNGDTPLHVINNESKSISKLVNAGAKLEIQNCKGQTPLFKSINSNGFLSSKHPQVYERFLNLGARLDTRDSKGQTLLHECITIKSRLAHLISLGLNPTTTDYAGNTLFHKIAAEKSSTRKVNTMEYLMSLGLDIDTTNHAGKTVLHMVCSTAFRDATPRMEQQPLEYVLSVCKNLNPRDLDGVRPLHLAASVSDAYVFQLLNTGVDMFEKTNEGLTVLHIAARTRQPNVIGLVLSRLTDLDEEKRKAFINQKDSTGRSALHYACRSGRPETVQALLEAGADPNRPSRTGPSVFTELAHFEEENKLWSNYERRVVGEALNAAGILLHDETRPYFGAENKPIRRVTGISLNGEHDTTRLDEILDLIATHGGFPGESKDIHFGQNFAASNDFEYTFDLLARLQDRASSASTNLSDVKPINYSTHNPDYRVCKYHGEGTKRALRECGRYRDNPRNLTDYSMSEMSFSYLERLIGLRQFDIFEERVTEDGFDLIQPKQSGHSMLHILVRFGYRDLLARVGSSELASKFDDYEWCKQAEVSTHCHSNAIWPLLLTACHRLVPNMEVVKLLIEQFGISMDAQRRVSVHSNGKSNNVLGESVLHHLIMGRSWWHVYQALPYFLKMGADLEIRDEKGATPLHAAVDSSRYRGVFYREAIRILLAAGADVNAVDTKGDTCLAKAGDDPELIKLLLAHGATVSAIAVFSAIETRQLDALEVLLSKGDFANTRRPGPETPTGNTRGTAHIVDSQMYPLLHASIYEVPSNHHNAEKSKELPVRNQIITALLNHGADPYAIFLEHVRKTDSKIYHGPNSGSEAKYEWITEERMVIHSMLSRSRLIEPLFQLASLKLEIRDSHGRTLLLAASSGNHTAACAKFEISPGVTRMAVEELIDRGADIMAQDNKGEGILHYMTKFLRPGPELIEVTRSIINKAPSLIHQTDKAGDSPLHHALRKGTVQYIDLFLEYGANPLQADSKGNTGLHRLTKLPHSQDRLFKHFLHAGVYINARNKKGNTPLFKYVKSGFVKDEYVARIQSHSDCNAFKASVFERYQDHGADLFTRNEAGTSLLHLLAAKKAHSFFQTDSGPDENVQRYKYLMELGLDPMAEDKRQRTSLDVAAACENEHILKLFELKPME